MEELRVLLDHSTDALELPEVSENTDAALIAKNPPPSRHELESRGKAPP